VGCNAGAAKDTLIARYNDIDSVKLLEILPQGVLLVEAPEWISTESVPMGGVNRIKLTVR